MQVRFLSLNHPLETGYLIDSNPEYVYGAAKSAVSWARKYDTYGDTITQHSGNQILQVCDMEDFFASLATYLMSGGEEGADRREHMEMVADCWPRNSEISSERIIFLAGLRQKDDKKTYYSSIDNKVSGSEGKRHDKRWSEVPDWADGSPAAVYRLAFDTEGRDHRDNLTRYALYDEMRDTIGSRLGYYGQHSVSWLYGGEEDDKAGQRLHFSQAFESVDLLVQAERKAKSARRSLECYLSNTRSMREPVATETEEQAA